MATIFRREGWELSPRPSLLRLRSQKTVPPLTPSRSGVLREDDGNGACPLMGLVTFRSRRYGAESYLVRFGAHSTRSRFHRLRKKIHLREKRLASIV